MKNILLNENIIPTIFYLSVALISILMYNKSNSSYNGETKRIQSVKSFMYLYKYIQISTITICILSIWLSHKYLLEVFEANNFMVYLGISISGIAITLFALSRFSLGENYSPCYDSYLPKNLKTTGIYSIVRHPIYTSNILLMIGIFISSGSIIIAINAFILFVYYFLSAFNEERALSRQFPKYEKYKKTTGMFLPHIVKKLG